MEILLFLGRLPDNRRVRRHFPDIGQIFKLLVIGRVSNDEGMPADLREEIGGWPRRGRGLHAQGRGAGGVVGASREGGGRAPGAGRVEGGGEEKERRPGTGAGRFDGHAAAAAAAATTAAYGGRRDLWALGMEGGEVRLWLQFETRTKCLPRHGDEKSMLQGHNEYNS